METINAAFNDVTIEEANTWAVCGIKLVINDGKVVGVEED